MLSEQRASRKFAALNQTQEVLMWRYITSQTPWHKNVLAVQILSSRLKQSLMGSFWGAALGMDNIQSQSLKTAILNARALGPISSFRQALAIKSSLQKWEQARQDNDFTVVQDALQKVVDDVRQEAQNKATAMNIDEPYDALLQSRTPGLSTYLFDNIAEDLKTFCYITRKQALGVQGEPAPHKFYMTQSQQDRLERLILDRIGYDFGRGKTAASPHPLCLGTHDDVRIGTSKNDDYTVTALTTGHEAGHGVYRQGLPAALKDTMEGQLAGIAMDEAMALIMENHVVRDRTFAAFLAEKLRTDFNDAAFDNVSGDLLFKHMKYVTHHPIRTESDEIRYPLDVILRYNIERALVNGDMEVADIPHVWAREYKKLTGIDVADDNHGTLQDIHWFGGEFGWFPNYLIGQLVAAQLFEMAAYDMPDLATTLSQGNVKPLRDWLSEKIYSKGATRNTFEIVEDATGHRLSAVPYKRHIGRRYLSGWPWSRYPEKTIQP